MGDGCSRDGRLRRKGRIEAAGMAVAVLGVGCPELYASVVTIRMYVNRTAYARVAVATAQGALESTWSTR